MRRLPQQGKEKCSPRVTLRIHQIKEKSAKGSKSGSASNDIDSLSGMDAGKTGEENNGVGPKACDPGGGEDGLDNTSATSHTETPSVTGSVTGGGTGSSGGASSGGCLGDDEIRSNRGAIDGGDGSKSDNNVAVTVSTSSAASTSGTNPSESTSDTGSTPALVKRSHSSDDDPAPEDGKKRRRKDEKGKTSGSTAGSPKSVPGGESEGEDAKSAESPGPKVPPLKIVISGGSLEETGTGGRNGKNGSGRHHLPYVVAAPSDMTESSSGGVSTQPSGGAGSGNGASGIGASVSGATASTTASEDAEERRSGSGEDATAPAPSNSGTGRGAHHQRVLRSHRGKKGSNKDSTSSGSGAPSPAGEGGSPRQVSPIPASDAGNDGDDKSTTVPGSSATGGGTSCEPDKNSSPPPPPPAPQELHPRKRKIRARDNSGASGSNNSGTSSSTTTSGGGGSNTGNNSGSESGSSSEPCLGGSGATLPSSTALDSITNSYQLFLNIRKQIERKRKGLFPVQPKPPRGFKDYLMNRCTYVLANNASNRVPPPSNKPPVDLHQGLKELYLNQEKERHRLLTQHVIEKEKLVLSVEQEILRVHGRAARALANQALPFSACTILRDEEVYSAITPEQEEKDRNARVRFNGRLFLSWLQDVDDKWEKIKEAMLLRHHNEADSLHAVQKMDWEWKMKELAICDFKASPVIDDTHVPTVHVSDDFDLLPA